ncbi:MAG: hypothetical protein J3Q66DRAFT_115641 [Benniella sp.]|nr:MAG: hypothetical protein J3Q66DRAFT_115641 [Benniella sp.]
MANRFLLCVLLPLCLPNDLGLHLDQPTSLPTDTLVDARLIELHDILHRPALHDNWTLRRQSLFVWQPEQHSIGGPQATSLRSTYSRMATVELPPELREYIVQYLDFTTLKYFSLVCRAWRLSAHPALWKHFSCKVRRVNLTSSEEYTVWLETIRKNAHSFKHIYDIKNDVRTPEIGELLLDRCHSLVTVEAASIRRDTQNTPRFWEEALGPLIERNWPSL